MPEQGAENQGGPEQKPDLKAVMQEAMGKLEAKNTEMGGGLLFGLGREGSDRRALVFPIPVPASVDNPGGGSKITELNLVVTSSGYKGLESDLKYGSSSGDANVRYLSMSEGINSPEFEEQNKDYIGYDADKEELVTFWHDRQITINKEGSEGPSHGLNPSVRLVDMADPEKILSIIKTNMDKIKADQEEARRKEEEYRQKIAPHIQVSQRLDEILG